MLPAIGVARTWEIPSLSVRRLTRTISLPSEPLQRNAGRYMHAQAFVKANSAKLNRHKGRQTIFMDYADLPDVLLLRRGLKVSAPTAGIQTTLYSLQCSVDSQSGRLRLLSVDTSHSVYMPVFNIVRLCRLSFQTLGRREQERRPRTRGHHRHMRNRTEMGRPKRFLGSA